MGALPVGESWGDTRVLLPPGAPAAWRNVFINETLTVAEGRISVEKVFAHLPVSLLAAALT